MRVRPLPPQTHFTERAASSTLPAESSEGPGRSSTDNGDLTHSPLAVWPLILSMNFLFRSTTTVGSRFLDRRLVTP